MLVCSSQGDVIIFVSRWVLIQGFSIFKSIQWWSIVYTSPVQFCLSFQRKVINCNMSTTSERLPKRPWTTAKLSLTKSHHLQKVYLQFWELKSPKMPTKGKVRNLKYRVCCSSNIRRSLFAKNFRSIFETVQGRSLFL